MFNFSSALFHNGEHSSLLLEFIVFAVLYITLHQTQHTQAAHIVQHNAQIQPGPCITHWIIFLIIFPDSLSQIRLCLRAYKKYIFNISLKELKELWIFLWRNAIPSLNYIGVPDNFTRQPPFLLKFDLMSLMAIFNRCGTFWQLLETFTHYQIPLFLRCASTDQVMQEMINPKCEAASSWCWGTWHVIFQLSFLWFYLRRSRLYPYVQFNLTEFFHVTLETDFQASLGLSIWHLLFSICLNLWFFYVQLIHCEKLMTHHFDK